MKISVLIITKNRPTLLKSCLNSLKKQTILPDEVVVVDSSSSQKSRNVCESFKKVLNLIYKKEKRLGIARARNTALKMARRDILAFFDDDCIPNKNWLQEISNYFQKNLETDILLGRCKNYFPENIFANVQQTYYDRWLMENLNNIDKEQKVNSKFFCDFENIALRREFIKNYHCSLDLPFRGWNEDIEMGYRLSSKGNFFYNPRMIIYHKHKTSFWPLMWRNFREGIADEYLKINQRIIVRESREKKIYSNWWSLCKKRSKKFTSLYKRIFFWILLFLYSLFYKTGRLSYSIKKFFFR